MEFKKCSRCGNFYVSNGNVCPKCAPKDDFEFSTFQNYIAENGVNQSLDAISGATGISVKNINRFIEYNNNNNNNNENLNQINENGGFDDANGVVGELESNDNGITFLI